MKTRFARLAGLVLVATLALWTVCSAANLDINVKITTSAGDSLVVPGQQLDITVDYSGPTLDHSQLDVFVDGSTLVSVSPQPQRTEVLSSTNRNFSWDTSGQGSGTMHISVIAVQTISVGIGATAFNTGFGDDSGLASLRVPVADKPTLAIYTTPYFQQPVRPGDIVQYTFQAQVQNAQAITIKDTLPDPSIATVVDGSINPAATPVGNTITWNLAKSTFAQSSVKLRIADADHLPPGTTQITNTGTASCLGGEITQSVTHAIQKPPVQLTLDIKPTVPHPGSLGPGDKIHYVLTATGSATPKDIILTDTLPNNTTLVTSSVKPAAVRTATTLQWTFKNAATATAQFDAVVTSPIPADIDVITDQLHGQLDPVSGASSTADKTNRLLLNDGTVEVQFVDANPTSLPDVQIPSSGALAALAARSWTTANTRETAKIAAEGVSLLLLRTKVDSTKAASIRFEIGAQDGSPTGDLWAVTDQSLVDASADGGHRDEGTSGPQSVTASVQTIGTDKYAFALYRSPRNFDGTGTDAQQSREVQLKATALDSSQKPLKAVDEEKIKVVRPLVVLQHGTFDSPEGWEECPLWRFSGHELRGYLGWNANFPFQTDRSSFAGVSGAAGYALPSSKAELQDLERVLNFWRDVTGTAGAQMDIVTHSYGGVVTRLVAQGAASTDLGNPLTREVTNFRSGRNWGHGLFHKMICIAATHRGSHTGNHLGVLNHSGLIRGLLRDVAASNGAPLDQGAVEDQMVLSPLLRSLQETRVPCHAIVGSGVCETNPFYADRFLKLWAVDKPGDVYQAVGSLLNSDGTKNWANFRKLSNYVFNGDYILQADDTQQDPNYDLTVSSYSMKGRMPRRAYSDYTDLQAFAPDQGTSLAGLLTHGDEISMGSGNPNTTFAVALRVANLLRQPTTSQLFAHFPATLAAPPTASEAGFSNPANFNPQWLYEKSAFSSSAVPRRGPRADAPLTLVVGGGTGTIVAPGQQIPVSISWPGKTVQSALVTWTGGRPNEEPTALLGPGQTTFTTAVSPRQQPGPFTVFAAVIADDGSAAEARLQFQAEQPVAYTAIKASPSAITVRAADPVVVNVYGQLGDGSWTSLAHSSALTLTSSNPSVVAVTPDRLLQPMGLGAATVTAAVPGAGSAAITVTVAGVSVPVSLVPVSTKPQSIKLRGTKPISVAFLASAGLDLSRLDPNSVRINGHKPIGVSLVDENRDRLKDAVATILPRDLGFTPGTHTLVMQAVTTGGTVISGQTTVTAK